MIISIPNKTTCMPKEKYELLTSLNSYGSLSNEFLNELEQQKVYKIDNVNSVISSIDRRYALSKNLFNNLTYKSRLRNQLFYQQNNAYLNKFLTVFIVENWHDKNQTYLIENIVANSCTPFKNPFIRNFNESNLMRLPNHLSDQYANCNGLEIKDIYNMWRASDSPDEFNEVLKQLANENKINPFYIYANASEETIRQLIDESNSVTKSNMRSDTISTSDVKSIINSGVLGLKYLSNFIYAYLLCITKDSLLLDVENELLTTNNGEYNFINLLFDFSGMNQNTIMGDQFSITSMNFDGFKYSPISSTEEKQYKLIKKYHQYKVSNAKQIATQNELPVFSCFPKEWLDSIGINYFENNIKVEPSLPIGFVYTKLDNYMFNVTETSTLGDFSFVGDYTLSKVKAKNEIVNLVNDSQKSVIEIVESAFNFEVEKINLKEAFLQTLTFTNNKIKALVLNNFTSGSQPFNMEVKQLTKNQLIQSNNAFVPIAFKTTKINQFTGEKEEIYFVSLVNFQPLSSFRKYTKSQRYLQYLNNLIEYDSIQDPSIYDQILVKRFGNTIKYNLANQEVYESFGEDFVMKITEQDVKEMQVIDNEKLAFLNGSLNIDEKLITKFKALKDKQDIILAKYTEEDKRLTDLIDSSILNDRYIEDDKIQLQSITARLNERLQLKETFPTKIQLQEKVSSDQRALFESISKEVQKLNEIQIEAKRDAIENKNYIPDSFFTGLKTRGIYIQEIEYLDQNQNTFKFNAKNFNKLSLDNIQDFTLSSLSFIVNKPFKIKVDGDAANIIYAGPMKVQITNSSISVGALNSSTILGFLDNRNAMVHPHSSPMNLSSNFVATEFFSYRRGCLGESSPYIYNAFSSTSPLKNVLVNAFIWLSSANSSDHWGRNYKFFPRYGSTSLVNLEEEAINLITINEYIESEEPLLKPKKQCEHEYENSICIHCGLECVDHNYDYDGICTICGHYNSRYDDSDEEDEIYDEEITPEQVNTAPNVYTPYSPLTNNNN